MFANRSEVQVLLPSALARGIGSRTVGERLATSVVCTYVRHAFGMQVTFGKDRSSFW